MTAKRNNALITIITNPSDHEGMFLFGQLPFGIQGQAYAGRVHAYGGGGGYTFSKDSGPAWLTVDADTGEVTGTVPLGIGEGSLTVTATSALLESTTRSFYVHTGSTIEPPGGIWPSRATPIPATIGQAYEFDLAPLLTNPTLPVSYALVGSLANHIVLDTGTGRLAAGGVTGSAGRLRCAVTCTDAAGQVATIPILIPVNAAITLTSDLPSAILGQAYKGQVTASGGSGGYKPKLAAKAVGYRYQVTTGALPAGLKLVPASGEIIGTPTAATGPTGAATFTITATDPLGAPGTIDASIPVLRGTPAVAAGRLAVGAADGSGAVVGVDYFAWLFGDGSDGDFTFTGSNAPSDGIAPLGGDGVNRAIRALYFNNLTISSGAKFAPDGHTIYVAGTLDIADCDAGAIQTPSSLSGFAPSRGGDGGVAGAGANVNASPGGEGEGFRCGGGGQGGGDTSLPGTTSAGDGGNGNGTNGGFGGVRGKFDFIKRSRSVLEDDIWVDPVLSENGHFRTSGIAGGSGGSGGGGGGGTGTLPGGNGGAGGDGGGLYRIYARNISRGAGTAVGAISANGHNGQNGVAAGFFGNRGGGGGGGGGGRLMVVYLTLSGTLSANCCRANGGNGGNGGNGSGTGTSGDGNDGGDGGSITTISVTDPASSHTTIGSAGGSHSGQAGGAGGACVADL